MDLFTLSAKLKLDSSDFDKGAKKAVGAGESMGDAITGQIDRITSAVKKMAAIWAGSKVIGAIKNITKSAVDAYSSYEQLVGGVQTLFGAQSLSLQEYAKQEGKTVKEVAAKYKSLQAAEKRVMDDAAEAYRTAGMSANQYMDTVTSFSAALISGLKGDTEEAAKVANMAIIDMSDNANKMGTDMGSIQHAYQGFAKQNYTMLDNLKLGYGGTKTEMQRLLKDAEALTGVKYDISNLSDVYKAIHAIQENMHITGTTAKEAAETIEGSMNSFKASWANMLTALSDPKGDVKKATSELINSGKTMLSNVLPAAQKAISSLGDFIAEAAPMIAKELPKLLAEFVPKFFRASKDLIKGLGKGFSEIFKKIKLSDIRLGLTKFTSMISTGFRNLRISLGKFFELGDDASWGQIAWKAILKIKDGLKKAKEQARIFLADYVGAGSDASWFEIAITALKNIKNNLGKIAGEVKITLANLLGMTDENGKPIDSADDTNWIEIGRTLKTKIVEAVKKAGVYLKVNLAEWLGITRDGKVIDNADDVSWDEIKDKIVEKIQTAKGKVKIGLAKFLGLDPNDPETDWGKIGAEIITRLANGISTAGNAIMDIVTTVVGSITKWLGDSGNLGKVTAFITAIIDSIVNNLSVIVPTLVNALVEVLSSPAVETALNNLIEAIVPLLGKVVDGLVTLAGNLVDSLILSKIRQAAAALGIDLSWLSTRTEPTSAGGAKKQTVTDEEIKAAASIGGTAAVGGAAGGKPLQKASTTSQNVLMASALLPIPGIAKAAVAGMGLLEKWANDTRASDVFNLGEKLTGWMPLNQKSPKYEAIEKIFKEDLERKSLLKAYQDADGVIQRVSGKPTAQAVGELVVKELSVDGMKNNSDPIANFSRLFPQIPFSFLLNPLMLFDFDAVQKRLDEIQKGTYYVHFQPIVQGFGSDLGVNNTQHYLHAKGLWTVPYDGYVAELHRNERVLTASQARHMDDDSGMSAARVSEIVGKTVSSVMERVNVYLGADKVGNLTTRRVNKNIKATNNARLRALGG